MIQFTIVSKQLKFQRNEQAVKTANVKKKAIYVKAKRLKLIENERRTTPGHILLPLVKSEDREVADHIISPLKERKAEECSL
jgi:hypothetical protein